MMCEAKIALTTNGNDILQKSSLKRARARVHTRTHARTHAHTHTHTTKTDYMRFLSVRKKENDYGENSGGGGGGGQIHIQRERQLVL